MSWMEYYGADYINWTRLFAREKGEIAKKSDEMEKLRVFASDLVLML
jgi:hypothetical protein